MSVEAYARLPVPPRPLIGRTREVDEVRRLLLEDETRLLTLTGPGGVGKTRLALDVAGRVEHAFAEGARFVDLASIEDPGLVMSAIGRACGLVHESAQSPLVAVIRALGERHLLLVLDNFEHLLEAAPEVGQLVEACRGLRILVTSRGPLRLRSELEFPVQPLRLPSVLPHATVLSATDMDSLTDNASVALFVQRARAVRPAFSLLPENARAVADVCIKLDGLPLAIELAAARTRFVPPSALLARLARPLDLQSAVRDAPERHRTLREAIAWSYALLSPDQQAVFRQMAVFVGGCSLEAAEAVCGSSASSEAAFDVLAGLVERNLLLSEDTDGGDGEVRFRFLETVREFALERLELSGEGGRARGAHALYFASFAAAAEPALGGAEQRAGLDRLARDLDNLRAALRRLIQVGDTHSLDQAAALAWSLWPFWWARGYLAEGRRWADAILAGTEASALARARAAWVASTAALDQSDYAAAPALIAESLTLFRELGDQLGLARALLVEGWAAPIHGDLIRAHEAHRESIEYSRQAHDDRGVILGLAGRANTAMLGGDLEGAARYNSEALVLARRLGDAHSQAQLLEALGVVALLDEDMARAAASLRQSVRLCLDVGSLELLCYCLIGLAGVALAEGSTRRAARLVGAAEGLRERAGLGVWPVRRDLERRLVDAVRGRLADSPIVLEQAWAESRGLSLRAAADLALTDSTSAELARAPQPDAAIGQVAAGPGLTPREKAVAQLIARGKTSKEIADALVITERTADTHAAHIRDKLGLRSRAEIAAWAVRTGLSDARVESS